METSYHLLQAIPLELYTENFTKLSNHFYNAFKSALSAAFVAPTAAALCVHVCTRQAAGKARQETPLPAGTAARVVAV